MPLFGRRSRSVSVSRPTTPSNNSPAMLAASQAFLGSQSPHAQAKLATGAAATALRSMSPTSTPVGQVQTKRMNDRQSSMPATRGRPQPSNLQRRSSSSSMTERTFRSESPGRPSTSNGLAAARQAEPPVPPLPQNLVDIPPIPKKSSRRSASIDDLATRKAINARPNPNRNSVAGAPAPNPASAAAKRVTSAQMAPQLERTDSNNSHNFSYPNRARPSSPPPQKQSFDIARNRTSDSLPISATDARSMEKTVAHAAEQPVKKKKKREGPLVEGSHLQAGTLGAKPKVTPLAPAPPVEQEDSPREAARGQNNARLTGQASHFPPSPVSPTDSRGSDSDSEARSKRASRALGALAKQPSVVREDWEGEQREGISSAEASPVVPHPAGSKRQSPPEANVSRKIEGTTNVPGIQQDATEQVTPVQNLTTPQLRQPSLSPSRSTRFSARLSADMTEGEKHEPPPRSLSPRKPALKHSGSPHTLPSDHGRVRDSSLSPSEATDLSTDGAPRRKKNAHVKFDNHPAVVGVAAESGSPISPQVTSPQNQKEKKWFGLRKSPNRVVLSEDSDDEDAMKPRPQLPTFGSVRGDRRTEIESSPSQRVLSSPSSSSSSSSLSSDTAPTTMEASVSSDHALGGLLAREAKQQRSDLLAPVPPEVTSVEGTGLHSDTESVYSQDEPNAPVPGLQPSVHAQTTTTDLQPETQAVGEKNSASAELPSIAVLPATPGTEEEKQHQDQWIVEVPGGFPSNNTAAVAPADEVSTTNITPAAEPSQFVQSHPEQDGRMASIQEEDSDRDSVYSDAAEDLSDLEGDGFGSINAIVRSPISPENDEKETPPASPVGTQVHKAVTDEKPDWDSTQTSWKDRKATAQRASLQPAVDIVEANRDTPTQRAAKKAAKSTSSTGQDNQAQASRKVDGSAQTTSQAGLMQSKWAKDQSGGGFRKSMRDPPEQRAPQTMRANRATANEDAPRPMRSSMRSSAPLASASTIQASSPQPRGALQKKNLPPATPNSAPPVRTLPPINNDSDSESSFKRRRRAKANDGGKYSMRRSMRAGSASERPISPVNMRSMSPVERRPFSSSGQPSMRTSLRAPIDNTPTLRGSPQETKRASIFGRKAKSPSRPTPMAGLNKSRFADSDDEGSHQPQRFRSRFGDSSDEEDNLRPVRGIPRRGLHDDSTDLEDSSDDEGGNRKHRNAKAKSTAFAVPSSPQVSERPTSPMSFETKKRRGLFGRLRKNKDDPNRPTSPVPELPRTTHSEVTNGTARAVDTKALGFRSDAEKEALIEQTRRKLEAAREPAASPAAGPTSPTSGKLQRRMTPSRVMSDSWPLPPKIPDDDQTVDRPVTSDGTRPTLNRQDSSATAATSPTIGFEADRRAGKKKRFPMLRKAFGLKD